MPLPIAHGLMGAAVVVALQPDKNDAADGRAFLLGVLLGITPDLDCLLQYLPFAPFAGRGWHHDFMHSLTFALLCGGLLALWQSRRGVRWRALLVYGAAMATHPLLDFLFTDSEGVELFWPFSPELVRLGLAPPIPYSWDHHSLLGKSVDLAQMSLMELCLFGAFFLLIWLVRQLARHKPAQA